MSLTTSSSSPASEERRPTPLAPTEAVSPVEVSGREVEEPVVVRAHVLLGEADREGWSVLAVPLALFVCLTAWLWLS